MKIRDESILNDEYIIGNNFLVKTNIWKEKNIVYISYIAPTLEQLKYFEFDFESFGASFLLSPITCSKGTHLINIYYFECIGQKMLYTCKKDNAISLFKKNSDSLYNLDINEIKDINCQEFTNYDIIFLKYLGKFNVIGNFLCNETTSQIYDFPESLSLSGYIVPTDEPDTSFIVSNFSSKTTAIQETTFPMTTIKKMETTVPITTIQKIETTIPKTTIKKMETTLPMTTIKKTETTLPMTTIKKTETTLPMTTIKKAETTLPITTIKKMETTTPMTTIKRTETTTPMTTIKKTETTIPITTIKKTETTLPMTTIKKTETTTPITTIKKMETTIPMTTIKKTETTTPMTTIKKTETTAPTSLVTSNIIYTTSPISSEIIQNPPNISSTINEKNCQLKCLDCDNESSRLDLCIKCNKNKGYYPSIVFGEDKYVECYNNDTKPTNYYFNNDTKYYEPCFSICKTCNYQGNEDVNNCTSCKTNYIFRPDEKNSTNCVIKCKHYFYILFGRYFCTENNQCPIESSLLIKSRGQCIDDCNNDDEFKYRYNYECLKKCPEESDVVEDNICKLKEQKKCYLYSDSLLDIDYKDLESNNFSVLIKRYIVGFEDTDFHVDFYQSHNYTITIYKTMYCLKELEIASTIIDFHECYEKIQKNYTLEGISLIILIADFLKNNKLVNTLFYFFHPETGEILSINGICDEAKFTVEKSLNYFPEIDVQQAQFFKDQNIDLFNTSDVFYNDLCCFFESPNGRDVPLKERILIFYPNITLCDDNCNDEGVNLTSMKAICECKLKEILSEAKDATKLVGLDFTDLIESLSIDVLKCFKNVFQYKYFIKCYGGFISLFLIVIQSICAIISYKVSMNKIRKTALTLIGKYSILLNSRISLQSPPRKSIKSVNPLSSLNNIYNNSNYSNSRLRNETNLRSSLKNTKKSKKRLLFRHKKKITKDNIINNKTQKPQIISPEKKPRKARKSLNCSALQLNGEKYIKEYLATAMDELDYDELIIRENRSFWRMFLDKLIANQKIIDLFYNNNWIIPKSIRLIFLIVMIDLYLVVNALFYNEAYIRDLYYLDKEETFFSFVPRSLNRIVYTSLASEVLDFIISLLFPTENKIKKIMIRKKNNVREMKDKIIISTKNIINNYVIFIIISYVLTIFSWYYISCFNNVYPYLKLEWIKSSIFIFIVIQLIIIIGCFIFAFLRFISIKCKNERIYKISNYFFS